MYDHLISVFRSDSDSNKVPEELRGSGALQWAGLLPRTWVQEGSGGGEQQAGRLAWMDTLSGASPNPHENLLCGTFDGTADWYECRPKTVFYPFACIRLFFFFFLKMNPWFSIMGETDIWNRKFKQKEKKITWFLNLDLDKHIDSLYSILVVLLCEVFHRKPYMGVTHRRQEAKNNCSSKRRGFVWFLSQVFIVRFP